MIRSRWVFIYTGFYLLATLALIALSNDLSKKVFKSFPKEGIDLEWYKYQWETYPYDSQKENFGERWHEDGL